jgi:hypothetical protein
LSGIVSLLITSELAHQGGEQVAGFPAPSTAFPLLVMTQCPFVALCDCPRKESFLIIYKDMFRFMGSRDR